jgi:hypothetical protein
MRLMKASIASTGLMPLFGTSASRVIAVTNWSKARFLEAANFAPAVRPGDRPVQPGACVSYWGTTMGTSDNPRDTFVIYGKDAEGNYWVHGYLRQETWDLIQEEFEQYP